jgi:outer membrane protein assembly factor BamB
MERYRIVGAALCAVVILAVAGLPVAGHAGSALWSKKLDQEVAWHRVTDVGTLLVGTEEGITSYNPETGEVAWKREDLKKIPESNLDEIKGTPFLLVAETTGKIQVKTKLHALNILTGETVWATEQLKGATVDAVPVPQKGYVLLLTTPFATGQSKLDMIALDLATGNAVWESQFEDKVDLFKAEGSGKMFMKFDLSGHMPPAFDEDSIYFTYAGLHRYDIATGKLVWKVPYDVTEKAIKRGNAQAVIAEGVIYTSAKGQLRAIDRATGQVKWTSKDFGGAISEMALKGDVIYGRMGGAFLDWTKNEWDLKKPLGVVAVNKGTGEMVWRYDDAEDSITNMVILEDQGTVLIADGKHLIGLDMNSQGNVKEAFKVKVEMKKKIGAGAVAGGVLKVGLGGWKALGKGGNEDPPVAISTRKNGTVVVRGKQHLVAFDPKTKEIPWSVQYQAPGVPGWAKVAMGAMTAVAYAQATSRALNTGYGTTENRWANEDRFKAIGNYQQFANQRFASAEATEQYVYVLTDVKEGDEKGAGIVGVNMDTGESDRQVMFKEKEPDYKVDEVTGRVFNVKDKKELVAFSVK